MKATCIVDESVQGLVLGLEVIHKLPDVVKLRNIQVHGRHIVCPEVLIDGVRRPAGHI